MALIFVNVTPNTSSHSAGCTLRKNSSVLSRRIFCSSTRHIAPTRANSMRMLPPHVSTEARGSASSLADIAEPLRLVVPVVARVHPEDVIEAGRAGGPQAGDQLGRRAHRPDAAAVHERDAVAGLLGLVHVVGGDQHC